MKTYIFQYRYYAMTVEVKHELDEAAARDRLRVILHIAQNTGLGGFSTDPSHYQLVEVK